MIKKNLSNFNLDRSLSPESQNKILTDYIDIFVQKSSLRNFIEKLSSEFLIPKENFDQDIKLFLVNNYKNSEGRFFSKFNITSTIKSFFKNLAIYFWILINQNFKKKEKLFFDIILDDVSHKNEAYRFKNFLKFFDKSLIISRVKLDKNFNYYLFNKYKGLNLKNSLKNKNLKILFFLIKVFFISLKERTNYCDIIFNLIRTIIKYESIFSSYIGNYLIQERHFTSSKLKCFIFKKHGGLKTILFQRNIAQLNGPGMYTYSNFFFSLGNKTHLQYLKCKSNFDKIYPVGSFFMNSVKFNKKSISRIPNFDLLHIGSNMNYFQNGHSKFIDDWLEQFNWLKVLNNKYPNLKICIKGRKGDGMKDNKIFMKLIKNSKLYFIDEHYEDKNIQNFDYDSSHSYDYALNAKVVCTWQSTMGFELLSLKKPCIFLDPGGRNTAHLPNDTYHNKIKVTDFNAFENLFFQIHNKNFKLDYLNTDDYCLDSKNTHEKIFNILMNDKKKFEKTKLDKQNANIKNLIK